VRALIWRMSSYVSAALRRLVAQRADHLCEYCLIHEDDTFFSCEVDHIISEKHGGTTREDNLAYACTFCNRFKGTDVGSVIWQTGKFSRFFNPRADQWADHFALDGVRIVPRTEIGEVTVRILGLNDDDRILERETLWAIGRYPSAAARERIARRTN
jgi:HNH endonuclease